MAKFIEVTAQNGENLILNADNIVSIHEKTEQFPARILTRSTDRAVRTVFVSDEELEAVKQQIKE